MMLIIGLNIWLIMIGTGRGSAVSYNQPEFSSNASWKLNAITFANNTKVGLNPYGIFINTNDTIHVADRENGRILIWFHDSYNEPDMILDGFNLTYSLFVTTNDDVYVSNGYNAQRVDKWIWNANSSMVAINVPSTCYSLFVDINDSLYCSLSNLNHVIKTLFNSSVSTTQIIAGTGCPGVTSNMLNNPQGIFVHLNLSLYVADCGNDRIQLFQYEELDAKTIAGNGAPQTIVLNCPSGIVLDGDEYLFIVDQNNNRIVGSQSNGFRCLIGCYGGGAASSQLNTPQSMAFDSYGNIFVTDRDNSRIQKFILVSNSSDDTTTSQVMTTSTTDTMESLTDVSESDDSLTLAISTTNADASYLPQDDTMPSQEMMASTTNIMESSASTSESVDSSSMAISTTSTDTFSSSKADTTTSQEMMTTTTDTMESSINDNESVDSSALTISTTSTNTSNSPNEDAMASLEMMTTTINTMESPIDSSPLPISTTSTNTSYSSNVVSYNEPTFNSSASWSANAITLADTTTVGSYPFSIFVNTNNTIYVADRANNRVQMWLTGNSTPTTVIANNLSSPYSIFVTSTGDIYTDNGYLDGRVDKWTLNPTTSTPTIYVSERCYGLFVDINDTLYCSVTTVHQVVAKSLSGGAKALKVVGGSGCYGSTSDRLAYPYGIFVDISFDLYVADCGNNRIQRFPSGQLAATTVAGTGVSDTITLSCPTGVVLDADKYLFIVDHGNHRIVGSRPTGFLCVAGCFGSGSAPNQLHGPWSMSFDSYGNIFVVDTYNNRIQKFAWIANSCEQGSTDTTQSSNYSSFITPTTVANVSHLPQTVSYNQPKFNPPASWSANAITLADATIVGSYPFSIFVNTNNTIYVADRANSRIQIWFEGNVTFSKNISGNMSNPHSLFVTITDDIYIDNGYQNGRVNKWTLNATSGVAEMSVDQQCYSLFVDIADTLYCSIMDLHQVVAQSLNSSSNALRIVAGNGCPGSTSFMLYLPCGIFVDVNFDLYVADCYNNRIQRFPLGQLSGTTVSRSDAYTLACPTGIVLDADNYLFIVDSGNHRIIVSGPNGSPSKCVAGCSGSGGSGHNQLYNPQSVAFDNHGNLFVSDMDNSRIQKFMLLNNSLAPSYNQPKFCLSVNWNPNAITLENNVSNSRPYGLYVNTHNTIYVTDQGNNQILIWFNDSIKLSNTISNVNSSFTVFVTANDDIYVGNGIGNSRVDKWTLNATSGILVMDVSSACTGLFVDVTNTLYCSVSNNHQVVKKWLDDGVITAALIAGTNGPGASSNALNSPRGIFVNINLDLYVADYGNNRIQLFQLGQLSALTVAGNGAPSTITLDCPTGVVLDADNYLFIVDSGSNRIVASGPIGFRCVLGSCEPDSAPNQLSNPQSMSFDSYGNIFVTDLGNNRIQKFVLATNSCIISYNQPTFSSCTAWYSNATTFSDSNIVGSTPHALFVNGINTVYMVNQNSSNILVWPQGNLNSTRTIFGNFSYPKSLFVSITGDIYLDTGYNRVDKWTLNSSSSVTVMNTNDSCYGLFIDTNNTLYCSLKFLHQVVKLSLNDSTKTITTAAGNATNGSESHLLNYPHGIFVDLNFYLYVADCLNNRIQRFHSGQLNGTTVGNQLSGNISLNRPTGIVLDADKYLFIVDSGNHRIVRSGPNGSHCLVGCSTSVGLALNQLNSPQSMAFDSYGNMFVVDQNNNRIQKFILSTNSCDEPTTLQSTLMSTTTEVETSSLSPIRTTILSSSALLTIDTTSVQQKATTSMTDTTDSTSISSTDSSTITDALSSSFVPRTCPGQNTIGTNCNTPSTPCDMFKPCQNNGNCTNTNTAIYGYNCACPRGFDGAQCQYDNRPCKPNTCWNNGTCNETSNTTFECACQNGWRGVHCEAIVNYCDNVKCLNKGVCRAIFLNYTCECPGTSYSGRHCEIVASSTVIRQTVTRSFGYIAIISLVAVALFIVIMDVLKYGYGIDPTKDELEKIRRAKAAKRAKRPPIIRRFIYVNALPQRSSTTTTTIEEDISDIKETRV